jgi:hypothetical protein
MSNAQMSIQEALQLLASGFDKENGMSRIQSTQKKFRDSFATPQLDTNNWNLVQTGAGQTVTQSAGVLTIAAGTTANAETIIESVETFTIPFRSMFGFMLSQRIANQEFYLELVSVNPDTLVPDGLHLAAWRLDGTTATTGIYEVAAGGLPKLASGATTINTTASYSIKEIECFADETWFHDRAMDSTSGRSGSWVRHQQIPYPTALYKVRIRVKNLGTAPATNTNFQLQYITVIDYAELTTEITASRGAAAAGMSMPVQVANTPAVSGTVTANMAANAGIGATSATNLGASATYTATTVDGGSSAQPYNRYRVMVGHTAGSTPAHLTFEQSTDNVTWRETHRIPIPSDGQVRTFEFAINARYVRAKVINGATAQTFFFFNSQYIRTDGPIDSDKTLTFIHSTTALAISAVFTGVTLNLGPNHSFNRHRALVYADQTGTLSFQQSRDGTNWRTTKTVAVSAGVTVVDEELIVSQYVRVLYTNGATANTVFELQSALVRQ